MRMFRKFRKNEEGATAVEFGLVSMLFLTSLFIIIEIARVFWAWNTLQYSVERAARYYLTHADMSDEELTEFVGNEMTGIEVDISTLTVTVAKTTSNDINFLQLNGSFTFSFMGYMLPDGVIGLNLTTMTILPINSSAS